MHKTIKRSEIIHHLGTIAQLTELDDDNPWKARAFMRVVEALESSKKEAFTCHEAMMLPGVGQSISEVLAELYVTGDSARSRGLRERWPADALSMTRVPGIGPKTAVKLYKGGVRDYEALLALARAGGLDERMRKAVLESEMIRVPRARALQLAEWIVCEMQPYVSKIEVCGSLRRKAMNSKDIDLVAIALDRGRALAAFSKLGSPINGGDSRASVRVTRYGITMQADVWLAEEEHWGAMVGFATGSKEHNIMLRARARELGLKINQYGIWQGDERVGGENERDAYDLLGIEWVPPESR